MADPLGIDVAAARARQARLLEHMRASDIPLAIVTGGANVQWLTGVRFPWLFASAAALSIDGTAVLVAPEKQKPEVAAVDRLATFEAQWHSTLRNDQPAACAAVLVEQLAVALPATGGLNLAKRIGVEYSSFGHHLAAATDAELVDLEPELYRLRRRKDPDELARIRKAIAATERMYQRAREVIEPGINELTVFNELQAAAVRECGEMLTGTGNDYRCGERGGPPRDRTARAGELYILDLGPAFRGYFADNCRTIAVAEPSDAQLRAWSAIVEVFTHVEGTVRPGVSAQRLFHEVQEMLDRAPVGVFNHHLGHGIGLFPHEAPHLNPRWDDVFEEGDVFTAEPGLYAPELNAGIRLENNYRVTADGVELLTPFPLEL